MTNRFHFALSIWVAAALLAGCHTDRARPHNLACDPTDLIPAGDGPTYLSPDSEPCVEDEYCEIVDTTLSPLDISDYANIQYQQLALQDCINLALSNSKVFRDLGGTIIRSPRAIEGIYNPAIVFSDPQFSEEAALSAFDANFTSAAFFQNNDQASNLTFQGNNGIFQQDLNDYQVQLQKLSATGSIFSLRNNTIYDNSNQTGQTLPHSWQTIFEGEFRQPLLQGAGTLFNRIAGPSRQPGVYGGVLIARTNTEISLSQFQAGVRDLVSEVENAYWDLYFAYRNLDAVVDGRDKAYEILIATTKGQSREGTQAQAQAKEQYLRFESDVLTAMEGRPTFGTRNNNGMSGGVFLSNGGVRVTERRLRLICGMPINSGELIRTTDEPASTGIQFDWQHSINEALTLRQELVQQRWLIKQRELQLIASNNFLKPRFDVVGQYRFRGLGRELTGNSNTFQEDLNNGTEISSAFGDLYSGDFQEWQVGAEFSMPIGFRAAHLGVRNAELALSRERAILKEQKREVVFGLSNAFGELRRAYASLKVTEEQYVAAREFQYVMRLEVDRGRDRDIELEAQRRVVDAEIAYRQAQVEYMFALKNIHFEKGTYLAYCNVNLSESQSNPQAELDAAERAARRGRPISYVTDSPIIGRQSSNNNSNFDPSGNLPTPPSSLESDVNESEHNSTFDGTNPIESGPLNELPPPPTDSLPAAGTSGLLLPGLLESSMLPPTNQASALQRPESSAMLSPINAESVVHFSPLFNNQPVKQLASQIPAVNGDRNGAGSTAKIELASSQSPSADQASASSRRKPIQKSSKPVSQTHSVSNSTVRPNDQPTIGPRFNQEAAMQANANILHSEPDSPRSPSSRRMWPSR